MDKATILGDAVKYVRELQDKVKTLEKDGVNGGTIQSSVLVKKPCRMPNEEGVPVASGGGNGGGLHHQQLPEIEARLSDVRGCADCGGGAAGEAAVGGGEDESFHHPHQRHAFPRLHCHHHNHNQGEYMITT
ncbi:hypothetical protein PR202_gb24390 [Eleusine coracana subsp. coracana]|uniref:Uncharacterized protein n=1 Tax=Eleusine coracana subsp. coracana TaxID=191504 RepID=A0AAV5FL35_ELECO|nr:hypothetical protein PR202_gb24390 [Eleusine coracana subsp. coracana]